MSQQSLRVRIRNAEREVKALRQREAERQAATQKATDAAKAFKAGQHHVIRQGGSRKAGTKAPLAGMAPGDVMSTEAVIIRTRLVFF
jgi:hypothetical protein